MQQGPGVLDGLSCYLSLILKHSDTKLDLKNIIDQNVDRGGGGGGVGACCAPSGSATVL